MALTLTAADAATDPPAAAVALAGTLGAAATVYGQPVALEGAGAGWLAVAGRTGDGAVSVPLAKGPWWLYAATAALLAPPARVLVTDGLDAVPTRCRNALAALIAGLGLTDPAGGKALPVVECIYPDETAVPSFPCVVLSVQGVNETDRGGVNAFDDRGYPTLVQILDSGQGTPADHRRLPTYERWRYRIERAVDGQRLPGVPESAYCVVEPNVIADPQLPYLSHYVSGLLVRAVCRVPRGLNV